MAEAVERESMEFDVVIVGAGPAGLAAAIRIKHLIRAIAEVKKIVGHRSLLAVGRERGASLSHRAPYCSTVFNSYQVFGQKPIKSQLFRENWHGVGAEYLC